MTSIESTNTAFPQTRKQRLSAMYIRIAFMLAVALELSLVVIPATANGATTIASLEKAIIASMYSDATVDKVHCLFTVRRNSFVESALADITLDSLSVRTLLTTQPRGLYPIVVYIYQSDGTEIHGQVTLYAQRFDSVLTVGTSTKRGQRGEEATPHIEFRETTKTIETPLRELSALAGSQFRRSARAGSILTAEMLEQIPDIEPGDVVTIKYRKGALVLNARGKSLGRGVIGETVRVRNLSSRKIVTGTISEVGVVTLRSS